QSAGELWQDDVRQGVAHTAATGFPNPVAVFPNQKIGDGVEIDLNLQISLGMLLVEPSLQRIQMEAECGSQHFVLIEKIEWDDVVSDAVKQLRAADAVLEIVMHAADEVLLHGAGSQPLCFLKALNLFRARTDVRSENDDRFR